jgi:hypothetical protein
MQIFVILSIAFVTPGTILAVVRKITRVKKKIKTKNVFKYEE